VTPQDPSIGNGHYGCGFEQPLEASLKALLPKDSELTFVHGDAHGDQENSGFLRENSLLVVIVVSDEDDCSTSDYAIFDPQSESNRTSGLNLACHNNQARLFDAERYVDTLKTLRPNNDNVIFGVIAGIPAELTKDDEFRRNHDLRTDKGATAYFNAVLADERMTDRVDDGGPTPFLAPACTTYWPDDMTRLDAFPPRRLVEVAKGFGSRGVIGSLCDSDFGATSGNLIRAIGEQLAAANDK
jgi:hypothetical protein